MSPKQLLLFAFLTNAMGGVAAAAEAISSDDLIEGNLYISLKATLRIEGLKDASAVGLSEHVCPLNREAFAPLRSSTSNYILSVGFEIPTSSSVVKIDYIPLLTIKREGKNCTIARVSGVIVPLFVPQRNANGGVRINWKLTQADSRNSGVLVELIKLMKNIVGVATGILNISNPIATFVGSSGFTELTTATTTLDSKFQNPTIEASDSVDWLFSRDRLVTIKGGKLKFARGGTFPANLTISIAEKRRSLLAEGTALPAAGDFRDSDIISRPIDFKTAGTKTYAQIANDSSVQVKSASLDDWLDKCEAALNYLRTTGGMTSVDIAGVFLRELNESAATFWGTPERYKAQFPNCPGDGIYKWLKEFWPEIREILPDKNRGRIKAAMRTLVEDAARVFLARGEGAAERRRATFDYYFAEKAIYEERQGPTSDVPIGRTGKEAVSVVEKIELSQFGCYDAPAYQSAENGNRVLAVSADGKQRFLVLIDIDTTKIGDDFPASKGLISSFRIRGLDPNSESDREKVNFAFQGQISHACEETKKNFSEFLTARPVIALASP